MGNLFKSPLHGTQSAMPRNAKTPRAASTATTKTNERRLVFAARRPGDEWPHSRAVVLFIYAPRVRLFKPGTAHHLLGQSRIISRSAPFDASNHGCKLPARYAPSRDFSRLNKIVTNHLALRKARTVPMHKASRVKNNIKKAPATVKTASGTKKCQPSFHALRKYRLLKPRRFALASTASTAKMNDDKKQRFISMLKISRAPWRPSPVGTKRQD